MRKDRGHQPGARAKDLLPIVPVFIGWDAKDREKIHDHNDEAPERAVRRAVRHGPGVDGVLLKKAAAQHPFNEGDPFRTFLFTVSSRPPSCPAAGRPGHTIRRSFHRHPVNPYIYLPDNILLAESLPGKAQ